MEPASEIVANDGGAHKTVDFGLSWDDKPIFVESTTFHIQRIIDWESAVDDLKARFEREVHRTNLNRALNILAPLELTRLTLSPKKLRCALTKIRDNSHGRLIIPLGSDRLDLNWAPAPHFPSFTEDSPFSPSDFAVTVGSGVKIFSVAATQVVLKWQGDAEEVVNRSLRNSLNEKRKQFSLKAPYLLVMRITSDYIPFPGIADILTRRIFKNHLSVVSG